MGQFRQDLDFLVGALQHGLDPMSGISMYQGALADRDARRSARQQAAIAAAQLQAEQMGEQRDFLSELGTLATDRARAGTSLEALLPELEVQLQTAGVRPKMYDDYLAGAGLGVLYPGGAGMSPTAPVDTLFDDDDRKAVWGQAASLAQSGVGRADARQQIGSAIKQSLGEAAYLSMRHLMDEAINMAYAGQPLG